MTDHQDCRHSVYRACFPTCISQLTSSPWQPAVLSPNSYVLHTLLVNVNRTSELHRSLAGVVGESPTPIYISHTNPLAKLHYVKCFPIKNYRRNDFHFRPFYFVNRIKVPFLFGYSTTEVFDLSFNFHCFFRHQIFLKGLLEGVLILTLILHTYSLISP